MSQKPALKVALNFFVNINRPKVRKGGPFLPREFLEGTVYMKRGT